MKFTMLSGEVGKRIAHCKKCPNLNSLSFCKLCGCFMPAKVRIPSSSCPILKWDEHKDEEAERKIALKQVD